VQRAYQAFVEIKQPDRRRVRKKNLAGSNTMFQKSWSRERTVEEIDWAWKNKIPHSDTEKWSGISKSGVHIEGYRDPRPTDFPVRNKGN
jgi:hypothetical protein